MDMGGGTGLSWLTLPTFASNGDVLTSFKHDL
jgi:hypothetical protein